jgi:predicted anti-sigma-YlaC factor YlaD
MNRLLRPVACRRVRRRLPAFADGGLPGRPSATILDHLERCPACRVEAERLVLLVHRLRRLAGPEPGASWQAVRSRIERDRVGRRERGLRWRTDLGGLVLVALTVAAAVGPVALRVPLAGGTVEAVGGTVEAWDRRAWLVEVSYAASVRSGTLSWPASADVGRLGWATIPASRPDHALPVRKEVTSTRTTGGSADVAARAAGPS